MTTNPSDGLEEEFDGNGHQSMVRLLYSRYPYDPGPPAGTPAPSCCTSAHAPCNQKAFKFLALPAEIRNIIYREALSPTMPSGLKQVVLTLAHPPLARVNKQLRDESLPIFYGENNFYINIKARSTQRPLGQRFCRGLGFPFERYVAMFEAFSAWGSGGPGTSCIRHVKSIRIHYDHCSQDRTTPSVSFHLGAPRPGIPRGWPSRRTRICEGVADWADLAAVRAALLGEMDAWASGRGSLSQLLPWWRMAAALWFCAKECPLAAEHVEMWCDVLPDFRRVASEA